MLKPLPEKGFRIKLFINIIYFLKYCYTGNKESNW